MTRRRLNRLSVRSLKRISCTTIAMELLRPDEGRETLGDPEPR